MIDWLTIATTVTITLCFSFVLIIVALPQQRKARHGYLLGYILSIGIIELVDLFSSPGDSLHQLLPPLLFLLGPLLYFYVVQTSHRQPYPKKKESLSRFVLHAVPAFILLLLPGIVLVLDNDMVLSGSGAMMPRSLHNSLLSAYVFHELAYVLASLWLISAFNRLSYSADKSVDKSVDKTANSSQRVRMLWLKRFCQLDLTILFLEILVDVLGEFFDISHWPIRTLLVFVLILMLITMAFWLIRQPEVIYDKDIQEKAEQVATEVSERKPQEKYQRSGLGQGSSGYFSDKLTRLMTDRQLFLENELTLGKLAEQVGLSTHNLSQILNETFGQSFYDYINQQRIEHAKTLLIKSNASIIDIAMASGFNAKASFYNTFKKATGLPPGQWRSQQQQGIIEDNGSDSLL